MWWGDMSQELLQEPRRAVEKDGLWYLWLNLYSRIVLKKEKEVHRGGYGSLTQCIREAQQWDTKDGVWLVENRKNVYLKESYKQVSFKEEALLQRLAQETLADVGLSAAVPPVLDIFIEPAGFVVFTMECYDDYKILSNAIADGSVTETVLKEIIFQIAFFLHVLTDRVGLNHRDIKTSNILYKPIDSKKRSLSYGGFSFNLDSQAEVALVDFGFSCAGGVIGEPALVRAGIYYGAKDPCPKVGRDLYLFICLLLRDLYLVGFHKQDRLVEWLEKRLWMPGMDVVGFIKKYLVKEPDWLYFLAGDSSLIFPHCEPTIILQSMIEEKLINSTHI
jgi:serine/threonine protein kinase